MNDCFITTDFSRDYFLLLTQVALKIGHRLTIVVEPMLERYFKAEELSTTDIYIFSDDDIIPSEINGVSRLVQCLKENPSYGMIGMSWKPNLTCEEMGKWCYRKESEHLLEVDHVGGIMAIRKGILARNISDMKLDYQNGIGDDKIACDIIRKKGYKVGLYTGTYFHHLGQGKSTVWK